MKTYTIWITSPASPPDHFTVHIAPSGQNAGSRARETNYTSAEDLKIDLKLALPPRSDIDGIIVKARQEGVADFTQFDVALSDESARRLGWIF